MTKQALIGRLFRLGNRIVERPLASPRVSRLLGMEPIRIRYEGRRSGRRFELPAYAVVRDEGVVVRVGVASTKQWWRNFRTARPLEIRLDGVWRAGVGVVHDRPHGWVEVHVTWT